ncbi:4-coumarate--CoA ligase-like 3 [Zea mays]|uniref:4-coumarate--CoA ligase n=1 Tax=Zea mays TaxID=4577 RepID=A0A1D6KA75_MAIZE|nr:4-coumarate--CoA ligase-like 3 [Zea mays]ONM00379.1 4-coumarate--CoA ligase-like 6 [Zea mays]ONM00380.1 4-coumarate--CoA ligase-like 6 [Zea mays]|eukprot:XP_023157062.1 4-coumarate--CoA ligase-like 3 [Zea mays]
MQDAVATHGPANAAAGATFYCAAAGVYASTHPPVALPSDPSLSLVPHIFARLPAARPDAPALVDAATAEALSRADLRRLVSALAAGLRRRRGLREGDVVLLALPNSIAFPVAFLAVLAAGSIATTMSPFSAPAEIAARVRDTSPALVFATLDNVGKLPPLRVPVVLVPDAFHLADEGAPEFAPFRELLLLDSEPLPGPSVGQDDAAAILYSSGTGGRSKGVVLTHRNLIATVELFVHFEASQYAAPACDNVYLAALPMFHVYGLSLFAVGLLSLGSTVVVMKRFDAGEAVKTIRRFKVTHFPVVPPIMAALVHTTKPAAMPLECLVQVSTGAAPSSRRLIDDFVKAFPHVDLIQGYGMTESAAVGTRGFNTSKHKKYGSVGLLAPNMHARIVHVETGCSLPPGSCGELWLHGPAIMKGYLNHVDPCAINGGWLRTGDIAYFDFDGYLYIVGRLKEVIKYKGFQIAPADLEAVLIEHPGIVDVAVTSTEDEEAGEVPVAFVVRKSGSGLSCTQVMEYVAKQVSPYKKVRKVVFVESIPKSPAGKVLRRLLRESLAASAVAGPTSYSESNSMRHSRL